MENSTEDVIVTSVFEVSHDSVMVDKIVEYLSQRRATRVLMSTKFRTTFKQNGYTVKCKL